MALHVLTQIKVTCSNSLHDLDSLDVLTDDWNLHVVPGSFKTESLSIHLHCQFAAEESKAILDIMNAFLSQPALTGQSTAVFAELHVRQENIMTDLSGLNVLIEKFYASYADVDGLSLAEMLLRVQRLCMNVGGLKSKITALEGYANRPSIEQAQATEQSPSASPSPAPQSQTE